ncbi:MAG TPA: MCE family protein [Streptosporangiaceae bacterium]
MRKRTAVKTAALATALGLAAAGCSSGSPGFNGIYSLPLPGGASLGSHPYTVTARFSNVVDLVPQSAVRVNNVAVGRISRIYLPANSWTASVTMIINGSVHLPANADAEVTSSSLLGEQYVALIAPPGGIAAGRLANHSVIPLSRTTGNATVEEVLGALSLLLNGGGIDQLHTITTQLNAALNGNEPEIRSLLGQINDLMGNLNSHRSDITSALVGLNQLAGTLRANNQQIGNVLDNLGPGLQVLNQQRGQLVTMLNALHTLTGVAVTTINKSQTDMAAELAALAPTLQQLANAGAALPQSLQVLLTYPFTDQVLNDIKGDYINTYLSVTAPPGTTIIPPISLKGASPALPFPAVGAAQTSSGRTSSGRAGGGH